MAQVVGAPFEHGDPRGPPEGAADERQILGEELILQRPGPGGDQDARSREQRRHEVGEGLAGARCPPRR